MRNRPKILLYLSVILTAMSAGLPIQIMLAYGHAPWEIESIAAKMAPLNWIIFLLAPVTAALVLRAAPALRLAVPILSTTVIYNNYLVAQVQGPYSWSFVAFSSLAFLGLMSLLAFGTAAEAISDPSLRWWLTSQRHRHHIPIRVRFLEREADEQKRTFLSSLDLVQVGFIPQGIDKDPGFMKPPSGQGDYTLTTFDLSETGAFLSMDEGDKTLKRMRVGCRCYVVLPLGAQEKLICQAEVVRHAAASGAYPQGIGLRFMHLSWLAQRKIGAYLARVAAQKSGVQPSSSEGHSAAA